MIQKAFRNDALSATQIKVRDKHFKDGQESVESDPRLEGLRQAEHLRMLNLYRLKSTKTDDD